MFQEQAQLFPVSFLSSTHSMRLFDAFKEITNRTSATNTVFQSQSIFPLNWFDWFRRKVLHSTSVEFVDSVDFMVIVRSIQNSFSFSVEFSSASFRVEFEYNECFTNIASRAFQLNSSSSFICENKRLGKCCDSSLEIKSMEHWAIVRCDGRKDEWRWWTRFNFERSSYGIVQYVPGKIRCTRMPDVHSITKSRQESVHDARWS